MTIKKCPCCSGNEFEECCQPIIENQSAKTALELMRSRFSAYSICSPQYLLDTTHISTRGNGDLKKIEQWSKENSWDKLEIVSTQLGKETDDSGTVEFKAHYTDALEQKQVHHERSSFKKEEGKWFYVDGEYTPQASSVKVSRNDACPCGSGMKYKKCCGRNA